MRLVSVDAECPFPAAQVWALKENNEFDQFNASKDNKQVCIEKQVFFTDSDGNSKFIKVMSFKITEDSIPLVVRTLVDAKTLAPTMTLEWFGNRFDESHACTYQVLTPAFEKSVQVQGKQWLVEKSDYECIVCTRFTVICNIPGLGIVVEQLVADMMQKGFSCYRERCTEFAQQQHTPITAFGASSSSSSSTPCDNESSERPCTPVQKSRITGWMRDSSTRSILLPSKEFAFDIDHPVDTSIYTPCAGCARIICYALTCVKRKCGAYRRGKHQRTVVVSLPPLDPGLSAECKALGIVE
jgi:hypothetical protein